MAPKKKLLPFLVPFGAGIFLVLCFLGFNLVQGKSVLLVKNQTGTDLIQGEIWISSSSTRQEVGYIKNMDSLALQFSGFSDGHYVVSGKFQNGMVFKDSGGYVTHGMKFQDEAVLIRNGDSIALILNQMNGKRSRD